MSSIAEFPHTFSSASGFPTFGSLPDPAMAGQFAEVYQQWTDAMNKEPAKLASFQRRYMEEHVQLLQHLMDGKDHPLPEDKRFSGEAWLQSPAYHYLAHSYLITSRLFLEAINELPMLPARKRRMRFFAKQYLDAIAPCNYLITNPDAMQKALESNGESLKVGLENLKGDIERGQISMTDESAFKVGENIAISEGAVVYENELFQLIQYKPLTENVHLRPLVMVPPCINKFYILDMRPENSLVRFAVEQGHTVFMVSWRNTKEDLGHLTWDHYVADGVIKAIDVARVITQVHKINVLGFCIGGTLVSCALSVLRSMGEDVVESLTLLTSFLDFSDTGEVSAYVDRGFVERREREVGQGGIVPGTELAFAFASLRANELVWNYVVNNYLKGQTPPAFDLLYWNADSTNLPGPMYSYYIKNAYLENNFVKPGKLSICGYPLDFADITQPAFVFAAREDHIVPWRTAYESARQLRGETSFTLGASGHIAGVVNPASKNRRSYWTGRFERSEVRPEGWLDKATELPGSWWTPWGNWLATYGGRKVPARKALGGAGFAPIEPAPGRYVLEKV
jgi:polyhydroxyalkanoate synthase subunit PhaC